MADEQRYDLVAYPTRTAGDDAGACRRYVTLGVWTAVTAVLLAGYRSGELAVGLGAGWLLVAGLWLWAPVTEVVEREVRAVPAGAGRRIVTAHEAERRRRDRLRNVVFGLLGLVTVAVGWSTGLPAGAVAAGGFVVAGAVRRRRGEGASGLEVVDEDVPARVAREEAAEVLADAEEP